MDDQKWQYVQDEGAGTTGMFLWRSVRGYQSHGDHEATSGNNSPMEGDVRGLATGATATEPGPNKRAVSYSGRTPAEPEKSGQNIVG